MLILLQQLLQLHVGLEAKWLKCCICDILVASLVGLPSNNSGQVVHTYVPL